MVRGGARALCRTGMEAGHWCRVRVPAARMCLARPLARNEGLGRGGRPTLMPPYTSLTHTSVCTVLHLVVFGESTLVSTIAATSLCSESMQSAAAARSQRCTRLTILLDWHAAHVGGAASGANRGAGSVAACFAMSARSQTPGCNLNPGDSDGDTLSPSSVRCSLLQCATASGTHYRMWYPLLL